MGEQDQPGRRRRSGSIPPSRRRLVAVLCLAMAAVLIGVLLLVGVITGSGVRWARLIIAVVFVLGIFGFYLWIRFSD